jgi:epsilon-lactone hydrolase
MSLPPATLTTGTADLFLSDTVRAHRKLREAGVEADLQVYEGLSHAPYTCDPIAPVTKQVFGEIGRFFGTHLTK